MSGKRLTYEKPAIIEFQALNAQGACINGHSDVACASGSNDASSCNQGSHAGSCINGVQASSSCNPTGNHASSGCGSGSTASGVCIPGIGGFVSYCIPHGSGR